MSNAPGYREQVRRRVIEGTTSDTGIEKPSQLAHQQPAGAHRSANLERDKFRIDEPFIAMDADKLTDGTAVATEIDVVDVIQETDPKIKPSAMYF